VNAVRHWQCNDPNQMPAHSPVLSPRWIILADPRMKAFGVPLDRPLRPTFSPARKGLLRPGFFLIHHCFDFDVRWTAGGPNRLQLACQPPARLTTGGF